MDRQLRRLQEESERPRSADAQVPAATREEARSAAAGLEVGPQAPDPSEAAGERVRAVSRLDAGDGRVGGAADTRPAAAASTAPAVSHEEQVRLAADEAEARLPRAMAAGTEDGFVRDTVAAVRRRQSGDDAPLRARAEEEHHAPAIAREHARLVAEHEEATRRRERARKPTWEDAARAVLERYLAQLRRIFEEACAWVREQLQAGRSAARSAAAGAEPGPPGPRAVRGRRRAGRGRPAGRRRPNRGGGLPSPGGGSDSTGGSP